MNNNDNKNNLSIVEKTEKYGNQKINFYKTLTLIVILFVILMPIRQKYLCLIEKSRLLTYYPAETQVYFDFETNHLTSKIKANKYMPDIAAKSEYFSFGFWKDPKSSYCNKLAVFKFKRKDQYFNLLHPKINDDTQPRLYTANLTFENYKHHKIFHLKNQNKLCTIDKEKLFITESPTVLKELIDRIENGRKGLLERRNVRKALELIDKKRDGTIFILDNKFLLNKSISKKIPGIAKIVDFVDISAFSVNFEDNNIITKGKTLLNYKKIKDRAVINSFKDFNKEPSVLNENCFIPEKSIMYATVGNFKNIFNLFLTLNDIKQQPEYTQMLDFMKDSIGLNVENDLLSKFNGCSSLVLVPEGKEIEAAGIFRTSKNPQPEITKLINFFQTQNSVVNIVDSDLRGYSLKHLKTDKIPYSIYFGMVGNNNFVVGQQNVLNEVIKAIKENQTPKNTLPKTQIAIYLDSNAAKEIIQRFKQRKIPVNGIDFIKAEFSIDDNVINSFIKIGGGDTT
ncbi:MAG: DUF3352 domain-containing protein [Candidatus Gastranaerophilaceae bacterium]|jgi:hypothetical protein